MLKKYGNILIHFRKFTRLENRGYLERYHLIEKSKKRDGYIKLGETDYIIAWFIIYQNIEDLIIKKQETVKGMNEVPEVCDICEL